MDEHTLAEKLRRIEALFAGAATEGERQAAAEATKRITARLHEVRDSDPPVEYRFSMGDQWSRRLFTALLRRYGLEPYRYARQRYTTVMVRVPKSFVDQTLWTEFQQLSDTLKTYLAEVTDRVIGQTIHSDVSEPVVRAEPLQISEEST